MMEHHINFIKYLINKGGPDLEDYQELNSWLQEIMDELKTGVLNNQKTQDLLMLLGDAATNKTLQGFVLQKPHGYAGDFEVIDKIYQKHISEEQSLKKWDIYFHTHPATQAVRNRVNYFAEQVKFIVNKKSNKNIEILNLASGPGRDMLNLFTQNTEVLEYTLIDCVEQDINAIKFASHLCEKYIDRVNFIQQNALKYTTAKKYDLIWSAGLFDYFEDRIFIFLLKRLKGMLKDTGDIIIGNFCPTNPSKAYMTLFEWNLRHRSPNTLRWLAMEAGFEKENITVDREPTGVNLFLHAKL